MKGLDTICKWIDKILTLLSGLLMIFLTALIGINVISRYIFNSPIKWQYEATLVCMPWVIFFGMAMAFKTDEHMRLTFVSNAIPEKARRIYLMVLDLIVLCFLAVGGYLSISVVQNAWPTVYQTIPVSKGLFYLPFPIGCVCGIIMIINNCYKRIHNIPLDTVKDDYQ